MVDAGTKMAHRIKGEQERHIASKNADDLIDECLERLVPILTHRRPVRYMSIPVNYERDDDVYILTRLREVQKRLRMEPNTLAKQYETTKDSQPCREPERAAFLTGWQRGREAGRFADEEYEWEQYRGA